ncbi:hypothetical protein V1264_009081 [Littorina saxatilis]|uniref:Solute carrier organic anion transporter family member n=1 Tax=Littorina saxatilis TaxID=31220 RepID=A0AAN9G155_9CAEN
MATELTKYVMKEEEDLTNGNSFPLVPLPVSKGLRDGTTHSVARDHHVKRLSSVSHGSRKMSVFENRCGVSLWKPQCLRRFNNPSCLLFFFSLYALSLGFVVNGINNVNTSSIERRFNLASARVGMISSAYDVSAAILGLLISYFGSGRYKARMVGVAVIISSLGSVLMALPHFTTGPYRLGGGSGTSLCNLASNTTTTVSSVTAAEQCEVEQENSLSHYLYVFILGQMLHGVGGTTIYTVGVALIDDSVNPSSTPLYLGILYGSAVLGPGLGYVVGGTFLSYYVDFDIVDTKLTGEDPRWVGAWWLGFILAAGVNLLVAFPILCFGAELPSAGTIRVTRVSQAHTHRVERVKDKTPASPPTPDGKLSVRHFVRTSMSLLSNPCFLFITLSMVTEGISLSGVATFMPKMIENKFRVSASWAATLSGLAVVPSAATGQFLGGFIAKRMNLGIPGLIRLCVLGMILTLLSLAIVWIDCGQEEIVGVTSPYSASLLHEKISLTSHCNAACHCNTDVFTRVCDENNTQYFSPCHAGCTSTVQAGVFTNCSCLFSANGEMSNATVKSSACRESCDILYPFLVLLFFLIGFNMIAVAPGDAIQLRCVPEENKTFAQGLKQMIVRVLGTVVGPILTGRLLDNTCKVWRQDCTGAALSCWLYNTDMMSASAYTGVAVTKVMSITFCLLALWLYRPPPPVVAPCGPAGSDADVHQPEERAGLKTLEHS